MTLFIHCYSKGHEGLQVTALHILCDMVTTHPTLLAPVVQPDGETVSTPAFQKPLFKAFARALKANSPESVQTAAATALSKLLLTNAFSQSGQHIPAALHEYNQTVVEALLQSLVVSFFHPRTRQNPALRQVLAYFFPVYCHSRIENTRNMRKVCVPVVRAVLNAAEEYFSLEADEDSDGDIDETAGQRETKALMSGLVGMLAEWTDERRVVGLGGDSILRDGVDGSNNACGFIHLALMKDILERVLGISTGPSRCSKEEMKLHFSLLGKLHIAPPLAPTHASRPSSRASELGDTFRSSVRSASHEQQATAVSIDGEQSQLIQEVKNLLDEAIQDGIAPDASGRNALVKMKNSVLKLMVAAQSGAKTGREPEDTEDLDTDTSMRSGTASLRGSVEPVGHVSGGRKGAPAEPSIIEEDENEESTIVGAKTESRV